MNYLKYNSLEPLIEPIEEDLDEENKEWDEDDWADYADCLRHEY